MVLTIVFLFIFFLELVYRQSFNPSYFHTISSLFSNFPKFYARLQFNNGNVYTPDLSRFHFYLSLSFCIEFFDYGFFFCFCFFSSVHSFPYVFDGFHKTFSFACRPTHAKRKQTKIGINKQTSKQKSNIIERGGKQKHQEASNRARGTQSLGTGNKNVEKKI